MKIYMMKPNGASAYINFDAFYKITRIFYIFAKFEIPFVDGYLEKKDVMRALDHQTVPSNISPNQVDVMFDGVLNPMFP